MSVALILAAGEGRRLGGTKALATIGGRTLIEIVVSTCRRSMVDEVVVVTGPEAAAVEAAGRGPETMAEDGEAELAPLRFVENRRWSEGRTGSLQVGWRSFEGQANLLLFPVDHPAVRLVTLDALLGVFGYAAAAPEVLVPVVERDGARRRGHPIVLAEKLRAEILELGPADPLNLFLRGRERLEVPVDDAGILLDVNEPEDLARAQELMLA